ncbi:hypothetical protein PTTG_26248, partial [Puccinia triticina 1-1 BBBD Race 1]
MSSFRRNKFCPCFHVLKDCNEPLEIYIEHAHDSPPSSATPHRTGSSTSGVDGVGSSNLNPVLRAGYVVLQQDLIKYTMETFTATLFDQHRGQNLVPC